MASGELVSFTGVAPHPWEYEKHKLDFKRKEGIKLEGVEEGIRSVKSRGKYDQYILHEILEKLILYF